MKLLEDRILEDGVIINNDILKVDSFLNHQIDVSLTRALAKEIAAEFPTAKKVLQLRPVVFHLLLRSQKN